MLHFRPFFVVAYFEVAKQSFTCFLWERIFHVLKSALFQELFPTVGNRFSSCKQSVQNRCSLWITILSFLGKAFLQMIFRWNIIFSLWMFITTPAVVKTKNMHRAPLLGLFLFFKESGNKSIRNIFSSVPFLVIYCFKKTRHIALLLVCEVVFLEALY